MTSITGSTTRSRSAVRRAAIVTHGKAERVAPALAELERVARAAGVELLYSDDEAEKLHRPETPRGAAAADVAVVLGGDGTMLRALQRFLGTGVPVIGVNFGRVGFLASIAPERMAEDLARAFAGELVFTELPTIEVEADGERHVGVNDVVIHSSILGRMVELAWALDEEDLGALPCDGLICCTPSGSTAYNLSSGGPVLVWGLEALAVTFVAPHSLHARPLVVPGGREIAIDNRTPDIPVTVIVDGHIVDERPPGGRAVVRLGAERSVLASLPEVTFFRRYRDTFGH